MRMRFCLSLLLAAWCTSAAADVIKVSECRGAHGERVFSDRADCSAASLREWLLAEPDHAAIPQPDAAESQSTRRPNRGGRRARADQRADSYLCSTATQSWYQHSPCRNSGTKGEKRESIRQSRVSRQQACREIARPAALLRNGSRRDERTGPYQRATGHDPCR